MPTRTDETSASTTTAIADTGASIRIEHSSDQATLISVIFDPIRRQHSLTILKTIFAALCLVPLIAWFIFRGSSGLIAATVCSFVVLYAIHSMFRQFSALTRSYIFRADQTGLTIETSYGQHQTIQHFTPAQITDINLEFSYYKGPHSFFRCWMVIKPISSFRPVECLQNLGGDHLARIANSLRRALGMEERSWP